MNIEKKIHRKVGEAIRKHAMIEEGDRILVAVSGGKDSTTLAKVLAEKRRYLPVRFELAACHIVTDLTPPEQQGIERLDRLFKELGIPLERRRVLVLGRLEEGRSLSCFFCAMQRRMELIRVATDLGYGKIAYGHHLDDIIETLLMNMFYNSEISTMPARLELDNHDLTIIRPLCLAKEHELALYARRFGLVEAAGPPCPYGEGGRRERVKRLIAELAGEDDRIRDNLSASLGRVKVGYLTEKRRESIRK